MILLARARTMLIESFIMTGEVWIVELRVECERCIVNRESNEM